MTARGTPTLGLVAHVAGVDYPLDSIAQVMAAKRAIFEEHRCYTAPVRYADGRRAHAVTDLSRNVRRGELYCGLWRRAEGGEAVYDAASNEGDWALTCDAPGPEQP